MHKAKGSLNMRFYELTGVNGITLNYFVDDFGVAIPVKAWTLFFMWTYY